MPDGEAMFPDGSIHAVNGGAAMFTGATAVSRYHLITIKHGIRLKLNTGMDPRKGWLKHQAMPYLTSLTGTEYLSPTGRLTTAGMRAALADCERLLNEIADTAVVYTEND